MLPCFKEKFFPARVFFKGPQVMNESGSLTLHDFTCETSFPNEPIQQELGDVKSCATTAHFIPDVFVITSNLKAKENPHVKPCSSLIHLKNRFDKANSKHGILPKDSKGNLPAHAFKHWPLPVVLSQHGCVNVAPHFFTSGSLEPNLKCVHFHAALRFSTFVKFQWQVFFTCHLKAVICSFNCVTFPGFSVDSTKSFLHPVLLSSVWKHLSPKLING